ncbi:MAG: glycosyltransferase family 9 protein [Candidatus Omnitrophota bacterium]
MKIDKSKVKKILLITLSNIGDVVLTLPVLRVIEREFPEADITVMVGPNAKEIFTGESSVSRIIVYNKHVSLSKKIQLGLRLRRRGFDMVVDLRNSLFQFLIGARYNSPLIKRSYSDIHRKDKHLKALASMGTSVDNPPFSIFLTRDDKLHINSVLNEFGILPDDNMVAMAAGSKSHTKRWATTGFLKLCDRLNKEMALKVILVGDDNDRAINKEIAAVGLKDVYDLSGRTNIRELAYLLSLCELLVTNDSAPVHIASAVGLPTVAIFGPTDPKKYGPLSDNSIVLVKGLRCSPCEKALCRFDLECMKKITADEVFNAAKEILQKK